MCVVFLGVCSDGRPAPPLKGQLRRRKEKEALAVSTAKISFYQSVYLSNVSGPPSSLCLSETDCDAELGDGQRNRDADAEGGGSQKNGGAQKVSFTQTQGEAANEEEEVSKSDRELFWLNSVLIFIEWINL